MKLLYTNESALLVNNAKNITDDLGFNVILKNEYASGGAGELSPFDTWLELWLIDDTDFVQANEQLLNALELNQKTDWFCQKCKEQNEGTFEICWQCQSPIDTI